MTFNSGGGSTVVVMGVVRRAMMDVLKIPYKRTKDIPNFWWTETDETVSVGRRSAKQKQTHTHTQLWPRKLAEIEHTTATLATIRYMVPNLDVVKEGEWKYRIWYLLFLQVEDVLSFWSVQLIFFLLQSPLWIHGTGIFPYTYHKNPPFM